MSVGKCTNWLWNSSTPLLWTIVCNNKPSQCQKSVSLSLCLCLSLSLSLSLLLFKFVLFFNYFPFEWLHPDIYSTVQKVCEVNDLDVGQVLAAAIHKWLLSPDTTQDADTVPHLSQYMFSWRWYPHAFCPVSQTFYFFHLFQYMFSWRWYPHAFCPVSICSVEDGTHMLSALSLRRFTFFSSCNSCWISLLVSCCWHINKVFETTATRVWLRLWAHNVHRMLSSSQKENPKKRWLKSFVQSRNIVVCLELMSMMLDRLCKHLSRKSWRVSLSSVNLQPTSSTIHGKWDLVVK